jgi:hypothetical protein
VYERDFARRDARIDELRTDVAVNVQRSLRGERCVPTVDGPVARIAPRAGVYAPVMIPALC